ncbi:retinoblastoma-family protein [Culex quinquefasciatus]|uniref:Retinoblastoma-family protein n=1 Tax=Culex quinquefasciatus TaxID=7176 RepID=B0XDW3_CULQU|nr:retinoblastoma-family protein [Culex quinquefasciatus]|eukprot:XP_001867835.1 retinoblastoma-family protein [Culex quinquefasciatus]
MHFGDLLHWLCCTVFVTCRQTVTPTVGNRNAVLQGNCVSLTRLLRLCGINLHEFFTKIGQWVEMASLPEENRTAINTLQHSFKVSMVIYGKFCELFTLVFRPPNQDEQKRSKKSKPVPCSTNRLHEFCWTLFIYAKHEYPEQSADVVTSCNMMLCCLDLVYSNAIADGRRDIVNPDFEGLPADFIAEGRIPLEPLCIIEALSEANCSSEALVTKNTIWKDVIETLFQTNVLRGDANSFTGLISLANFDENFKSLNSRYDTFILSCGEFDERIALGQKIVENPRIKSERDAPERIPLCQQTPLSGRSRISKDECNNKFTPISTANASVNKLRMKLRYDGEPHGSLRELLKSCAQDPIAIVTGRIAAEREKFSKQMREQNWNQKSTTARFDMIEALYYRLLENIIRAEIRRRGGNVIRQVCCEEMFNKTLLVCCAEIVIYAHNLQQNFPWILKMFDMQPFIFYRIIEMVILYHNDLLSRDLIKHLTIIEEQCLESLSWQSSSPLWTVMDNIKYEVTASHGVESSTDLSGITPHKPGDSVTKANGQAKLEATPSTSAAVAAVVSAEGRKVSNPDSAKKRLFKLDDDEPKASTSADDQKPTTSSCEAETDKKDPPKETVGPRANLNQPFLSTLGFNSPLKLPVPNGSLSKQRPGASSLNLFFRKFYGVAAVRMKDLCNNLGLTSDDKQKQIWTIFEHSIVHCTRELMRDRHLDQMLMCAIYVFVKVTKLPNTFTDIMKFYRIQPQSNSHVYRSVFIARTTPADQQQQQNGETQRDEVTVTRGIAPIDLAGVSMQHGSEERGDIIMFYNKVYVPLMQEFAIPFGNGDKRSLMLSPPPKTPSRSVMQSPKQIDGRISLYITPMDRKCADLKESPNSVTYLIDRSPAKDLDVINRIVKNASITGCKRSLNDPESYEPPVGLIKPRRKNTKLDRLISDRQQ